MASRWRARPECANAMNVWSSNQNAGNVGSKQDHGQDDSEDDHGCCRADHDGITATELQSFARLRFTLTITRHITGVCRQREGSTRR